MLEFCTVGNDTVSFWRVKQDGVLESDDIKLEGLTQLQDVQATCVEYCYPT